VNCHTSPTTGKSDGWGPGPLVRGAGVCACVHERGRAFARTSSHNFSGFLFCRMWIAFVSFRRVRGLMAFLPFLKFIIALLATPDWRESSLFENCFASARI
jgi:hypothetical protein